MVVKKKAGSKSAEMTIGDVTRLWETATVSRSGMCVVTGSEEALRRLVVEQLLANRPADTELIRISAGDKGSAARIDDAAQPAMFGGPTWLRVTELELGGDEVRDAVERVLPATGPDFRLILEHGGGNQGIGTVRAVEKAGAEKFEARPVAASAMPQLLTGYAAEYATLKPDAAAAMIDILGSDLTALFGAVRQMASDAPTGVIDIELVQNTLIGDGDGTPWELADLVWQRETIAALTLYRQLVEREGKGVGVVVMVALSNSLRAMVKCVDGPPPGNQWQMASTLGVPGWKVPQILAQTKMWGEEGLASAAIRLSATDAAMKGGLGRGNALDDMQKMFTIEQLIIDLTTAS